METKDFPKEEYESRWSRAQGYMEENGLDAILVSERNNYLYFTGHHTNQFGNKMRPMLFLLPRSGEPVMMIYEFETPRARQETWIEDIRSYVDVPFPPELVSGTIEDLGLAAGRIGCELGLNQRLWLPFDDLESIRRRLPNAELVDASQVYVRCRMAKSERELARMEEACRIAEIAWELILRRMRVGVTIGEAKDIVLRALVDAGSQPVTPGFVLLDAMGQGDDYAYQKGDLFFCDFGGSYRDYKSDIARLATFGEPSPEKVADHGRIVKIIDAMISGMGPGKRAQEIAEICNTQLREIGMPPLQGSKRVGHGCGLDLQEPPSLNVVDETTLVPGTVLTPEPRFVRNGEFVMVEENVAITQDGVRRLSRGSDVLRVIEG